MSKQHTISVSAEIAGRTMKLEYGKVAEQADCAVWASYGETVMLATAVLGRDNPSLGYFPLSIEYVERLYASGKIKGSQWVKREGRPTDFATLTGRLIDRAMRPLFPDGLTNEVQVTVTELSYDPDCETDVLGFAAAAAALAGSKIPWNGPVAATKVGRVDGEFVANPSEEQRKESDMFLLASSSQDLVNMIEFEGAQVDDEEFLKALNFAHTESQKILDLINEFVKKINPQKIEFSEPEVNEDYVKEAMPIVKKEIVKMMNDGVKVDHGVAWEALEANVSENLKEDEELDTSAWKAAFEKAWKKTVRALVADDKRLDGRTYKDLRELSSEVGVLPRVHGSALFSRGDTQALTVVTLGSPSLAQRIESTTEDMEKHYMHHYNFPPYSVGESGRIGSPKRREIGHGALAEKALQWVIPALRDFPYAIRVVSDIMSSNGSTSQASVSGSTLALMDAGVPLKAPVAGVAMGLISDAPNGPVILSDMAGNEDFNGDMDFKVAGSKSGITAIQLDVKVPGLSLDLVREIIMRAREDRLKILENMLAALPEARSAVSTYAPKVAVIELPEDKIGEVIGPGGKMIRKIIADTGAEVDIDDNGVATVTAVSPDGVAKAMEMIKGLITDPEVGQLYEGKVVRIMPFGAFVEIMPGKDGLVHVSKLARGYIEKVEDVVKIGDTLQVKVEEIDDMGRLNLTALLDDGNDGSDEYMKQRPKSDMEFNARGGGRRRDGGRGRGNNRRGGGRR